MPEPVWGVRVLVTERTQTDGFSQKLPFFSKTVVFLRNGAPISLEARVEMDTYCLKYYVGMRSPLRYGMVVSFRTQPSLRYRHVLPLPRQRRESCSLNQDRKNTSKTCGCCGEIHVKLGSSKTFFVLHVGPRSIVISTEREIS